MKHNTILPRTVILSILAFVVAAIVKFTLKGAIYDDAWDVLLLLAVLIPCWSIAWDIKGDILDHLRTILDRLNKAIDPGKVFHIATSSQAVASVIKSLESANEVWNTFVISSTTPYDRETGKNIENALFTFIQRENTKLHEIVSSYGQHRVDSIRKRFPDSSIPSNYYPHLVRKDCDDFPICDFIVLRGDHASLRHKQEVYFGWGYSSWSTRQDVFWSNDAQLIDFFRGYYQALRAISEKV
jgi:hypothetical protein